MRGAIDYWFVACDENPPYGSTGRVQFEETLPANTRWFEFPPSTEARTNAIKEFYFMIEARGEANSVVAANGMAMTAEVPQACWDLSSEGMDVQ